jgi:hypothetical protein
MSFAGARFQQIPLRFDKQFFPLCRRKRELYTMGKKWRMYEKPSVHAIPLSQVVRYVCEVRIFYNLFQLLFNPAPKLQVSANLH